MPFSCDVQKYKDLTSTFTQLKNLLEEKGRSLKYDETQGFIIWLDGVEGANPNAFQIKIEKKYPSHEGFSYICQISI